MSLVRANALRIPLRDGSVDCIITSPPYYAQRLYEAGDTQIGAEPHPQQYLERLWEFSEEMWRVLTKSGSAFVNLGDKRGGSGAPGTTSQLGNTLQGTPSQERSGRVQGERSGMTSGYTQEWFGRKKGRQMLPERYAIGCADGLADPERIGWVVRQGLIWLKPNGMPESVTDRCRDATELFFHLTKEERYFANIDELRVPYTTDDRDSALRRSYPPGSASSMGADGEHIEMDGPFVGLPLNERGRIPDPVWEIATEPLIIPDWLDVEHFATFPVEWPRRLILGWCPKEVCLECGFGRFQVSSKQVVADRLTRVQGRLGEVGRFDGQDGRLGDRMKAIHTPTGHYACACTPIISNRGKRGDWREGRVASEHMAADPTGRTAGHATPRRPGSFGEDGANPPPEFPSKQYDFESWRPAPTRKAVVLDPFGGSGTTALTAIALGRIGISLDLSESYQRLARWRIFESNHDAKVRERTNRAAQVTLF